MRSTICAAALLLHVVSAAQAQAPAAPLTIEAAAPDAGAGTLTISGTGFGVRPLVTLDLVPLNIKLALDQRIIAVVPVEMIPPGSYLLTVIARTTACRQRVAGGANRRHSRALIVAPRVGRRSFRQRFRSDASPRAVRGRRPRG